MAYQIGYWNLKTKKVEEYIHTNLEFLSEAEIFCRSLNDKRIPIGEDEFYGHLYSHEYWVH